ncbi:MAG: septum formation protein Maf [Proteobacteria bacterium]|nr:septum formation protein Maf [Pseudomonadota bacterium]
MALWLAPDPLILASRSRARQDMLVAAGIPIELAGADIDERALEARNPTANAGEAAMMLAREKARPVAASHPGRFVVGGDQILVLGERRYAKPRDRAGAREQLRGLSGRTHELHSAVVVARDGRAVFSHVDVARLTMRTLSDRFIDNYLDAVGDDAAASVGAYQLEKIGAHLFERIDGDHFTILGLPLLALLAFLRREGCLIT